MGFDPSIRTEAFGGTDKSWLRFPRVGLDRMLGIMLDMSQFTTDNLINGRIPSGTVLAKITGTGAGGVIGYYGPYTTADTTTGLGVVAGHLFEDVAAGHYPDVANVDPATHPDVAAALYWTGVVLESKLPNFTAATGKIDTAGKADVASLIKYV